jgi:uncharacterized membrane protein YhaH (DUF805 family)
MKTFKELMHCDGRTGRLTYQRNIALLAVGKAAIDLVTLALVPGTSAGLVALSWLNPFVLVDPWTQGAVPFAICLGTFGFFAGLVWNSVHRLRDAGHAHWLGLLTAVPFANLPAATVLCLLPARKHTVWDLV